MARRHEIAMESGGWLLLVLAVVALLYFFFHPKGQQSVTSTLAPTPGVPKVTSEIADLIASGVVTARTWSPGTQCTGNEQLMDNGSGQLWCVGVPPGNVI